MPQPKSESPKRTPVSPFAHKAEVEYPRAGIRQTDDGRWMLCLWDGDRVVHVIDEPVFDQRMNAFDYGWLTIGACRESGADLNGFPV